ncbi:MAG: phosphoribosylformylglycinamidine synthase subunit PurQ [Acidimicrobiales bacterium]
MAPRVGVVVFPGTNCEHDVVSALATAGALPELVWHRHRDLAGLDAVVLPGGFAHGDYLRPGAIARFSPVMAGVEAFASAGGPVLGICNGFQVLTEAGLLPGALGKNRGLRFMCATVKVEVASATSVLTAGVSPGTELELPVNNFDGSYVCDRDLYRALVDQDRVVLRYLEDINGSLGNIAGVCNEARNVVGIMPHPERASSELTGGTDGLALLGAFVGAAS